MIQQQLFLVLAINSLICLGVHVVTRDGMLFGHVADYIRHYIGEFPSKPLFDCPPCMASVWGIIGWFYFIPDIALIPYILTLCGVNALVNKIYYYGD